MFFFKIVVGLFFIYLSFTRSDMSFSVFAWCLMCLLLLIFGVFFCFVKKYYIFFKVLFLLNLVCW